LSRLLRRATSGSDGRHTCLLQKRQRPPCRARKPSWNGSGSPGDVGQPRPADSGIVPQQLSDGGPRRLPLCRKAAVMATAPACRPERRPSRGARTNASARLLARSVQAPGSCFWRRAGPGRISPRGPRRIRSRAVGRRQCKRSRVRVAERKQVLRCDSGEHRRVDGAESLADGDKHVAGEGHADTCLRARPGTRRRRRHRDCLCPIAITRRGRSGPQLTAPSSRSSHGTDRHVAWRFRAIPATGNRVSDYCSAGRPPASAAPASPAEAAR
jgi:hypothetical protein